MSARRLGNWSSASLSDGHSDAVCGAAPRRLLIVSPHFPPTNAPDAHRVRLSLRYYREFGWEPIVLAVNPAFVEGTQEPLLLETIPSDVTVRRVAAVPVRWTKSLGFGALGLRAFPFLYQGGVSIIRQESPDLIFISTTMFHVMALGRLWKRKFAIPFVLDMQDPWVNEYVDRESAIRRGIKHRAAAGIHRVLEPWTMRSVDGLVAVSEAYHVELRRRYRWIPETSCLTLPFGASADDYDAAAKSQVENQFFAAGDGLIHGVYAGCLGIAMRFSCTVICHALRLGLDEFPDLFRRVQLHFVGTDYAPGNRARETIRPIARELGVEAFVQEQPQRVPYFSALNLLTKADFLLVPGSADSTYTASKLYPYILARRPMLAVFHENSSVVRALHDTNAGDVCTFGDDEQPDVLARRLVRLWAKLLQQLPFTPPTNWKSFEPYSAREMTRRQCGLFDEIVCARKSSEDPQPLIASLAARQ